MNENSRLTSQQTVQIARLQAWAVSLICGLLGLLAIAAATRIPHYLDTTDYVRLASAILFALLVLAGLISNLHTHICLWKLNKEV